MENIEQGGTRLIPALPAGDFISEPEEIDRFTVQLLTDGTIYFKGTRARIEEFLEGCAAVGLDVHVDHISLCG